MRKNIKISYHEIPSDMEVREKWLELIGREGWAPNSNSNSSKVCSLHFKKTDFVTTGLGKRRHLRKGTVPSIFPGDPEFGKVVETSGTEDEAEDKKNEKAPGTSQSVADDRLRQSSLVVWREDQPFEHTAKSFSPTASQTQPSRPEGGTYNAARPKRVIIRHVPPPTSSAGYCPQRVPGTSTMQPVLRKLVLASRQSADDVDLPSSTVPVAGTYAGSRGEYIVPTVSDSSALSTPSGGSRDATSSLVLSDVRSLAEQPSTAQTPDSSAIRIKEEPPEESMEDDTCHITTASSQPATFGAPTYSTPAVSTSTFSTSAYDCPSVSVTGERAFKVPRTVAHAVVVTSATNGPLPCRSSNHSSPSPLHQQADRRPDQSGSASTPSRHSYPCGSFLLGRKRTAIPLNVYSVSERKARIELELLLARKRKVEAEMKKAEADERKAVAETLLMNEEMKRCDEEKKKLKVEAEYFMQEKRKSVEETRKAAAEADLLYEQKKFYSEQQKTEAVRRRMLLLELKKLQQDLKLTQC